MNAVIPKVSRRIALIASLDLMALSVNTAPAKSIKKQNFMDLMTHADSIVTGSVSDQTDGFQGGLPYTEISLAVSQSLKGDHG
jgi:hypothetical protein